MDWIKEIFNFENIGSKLKTWAKWSCWISIIITWVGAAISFLVFLFAEGMFLLALLVPVGAAFYSLLIWIGTWTTYALGQYVEDIHIIRTKGVPVIKEATILPSQKDTFVSARESASPAELLHKWRCDSCGNMRSQTPCEYCGRNEKAPKAPYKCGACGLEGPYDGNCPSCGSGIKLYNH